MMSPPQTNCSFTSFTYRLFPEAMLANRGVDRLNVELLTLDLAVMLVFLPATVCRLALEVLYSR